MKKADLRTGMRVTTRDGIVYVVLLNFNYEGGKKEDVMINPFGAPLWNRLRHYNDDLTNKGYEIFDIVKVERSDNIYSMFSKDCRYTTIWERQEPKEMTLEEIEALLGYPIKIKEGK